MAELGRALAYRFDWTSQPRRAREDRPERHRSGYRQDHAASWDARRSECKIRVRVVLTVKDAQVALGHGDAGMPEQNGHELEGGAP